MIKINELDRNKSICNLYKDGKTLAEVGDIFGLTRERIRQIVKSNGLTNIDGGSKVRQLKDGRKKRNEYKEKMDMDKIKKYGCTQDVYDHFRGFDKDFKKTPLWRFCEQRRNAKKRGINWDLTFPQWWSIWDESGKYSRRGRHKGEYVMTRIGDVGDYSQDNIEIKEHGDNIRDYIEVYRNNLKNNED